MKNWDPLFEAATGAAATQQCLGGGKWPERGRELRLRAHTRGGKSHGLK